MAVTHYLGNAKIIRDTFIEIGFEVGCCAQWPPPPPPPPDPPHPPFPHTRSQAWCGWRGTVGWGCWALTPKSC
jgi:hypothetical protein